LVSSKTTLPSNFFQNVGKSHNQGKYTNILSQKMHKKSARRLVLLNITWWFLMINFLLSVPTDQENCTIKTGY